MQSSQIDCRLADFYHQIRLPGIVRLNAQATRNRIFTTHELPYTGSDGLRHTSIAALHYKASQRKLSSCKPMYRAATQTSTNLPTGSHCKPNAGLRNRQ